MPTLPRSVAVLWLLLVGCSDSLCPSARSRPQRIEREPYSEEDRQELTRGGGCPSDEAIRQLHAAAFHFEHGRPQDGREALERARAALPPLAEQSTALIFTRLSTIAKTATEDADATRMQTEEVRALLTDWGCLSQERHDQLHVELDRGPQPQAPSMPTDPQDPDARPAVDDEERPSASAP